MNTNIVIDDALINQAMKLTGLKTQKDLVEIALKTLIADKTRDKLASAFGQYPWEGDLEAMRTDRCSS
jgi:Arc/MetJ family transcription regulator